MEMLSEIAHGANSLNNANKMIVLIRSDANILR